MHLLASQPGGYSDDEGIIDLDQTAADIVILSAADSALAALAQAAESLPHDFPSIRLANWVQLIKPAAYDLYEQKVISQARVVVVSLLGGINYWQYGYERLLAWSEQASQQAHKTRTLIFVPGDDSPDEVLFSASSVNEQDALRVWRFLREGGVSNNQQLYYFVADRYLQKHYQWHAAQVLPRCMIYMPASLANYYGAKSVKAHNQASYKDWQQRWQASSGSDKKIKVDHVCVVIFYRSHLQSANHGMFDGLIRLLEEEGLQPLPIAITSLKDAESIALANALIEQANAKVIINTTSFASNRVASPDLSSQPSEFLSPFSRRIPVLQLILSSSTFDDWQTRNVGLRSRDIAMQVVLPEMDGRIVTRAISFKSQAYYSQRCQISIVAYELHEERAKFITQLALAYCRLANKKNSEKRIAVILANYPTKDGRIGNGVGLDTPQSTINILRAMENSGYELGNIPENGTALIKALLGSVTNNPNTLHMLPCWQSIHVRDYWQYFQKLPDNCQQAVIERWGMPEHDPKYRSDRIMLAGMRIGKTFIGIQPARGFNMDLLANYHDPDLIPPHSYLAFYFWLRHCYGVDAFIHVGKHGNLEWLPGKGTALSDQCWPDIALGPIPHFYPFIVNDPGEGAQAKRRTQATIIDHLMPPMARAEVYGELAQLEHLVDEYYQALGLDQRRERWLREKILQQVKDGHILQELGCQQDNQEQVLANLDAYLCDIKEAQIRNGLHILGDLPTVDKMAETIVALLRLPRGKTEEAQGILHNLVADFDLRHNGELFDPLSVANEKWCGDQPELLLQLNTRPWYSQADTRERLELLAVHWVQHYVLENTAMDQSFKHRYPASAKQLSYAKSAVLTALKQSAEQEVNALIRGLAGEFVDPGPSGAPTRGRLDTLPTGRNFFSLDNRSIPSAAAWAIGQASAHTLIERHLQDHGDYPKQLALSVWGTATMRTGGDDIAQAFALMGIKPIWAEGSQRVVDFEITPAILLNRPRVDVTLRVSGFFRDAFPNVMKLYDAAVQALAEYEDPGGMNTVRNNVQQQTQQLQEQGIDQQQAKRQASYRVFGSKPGAYGAGLQGLIDERCWQSREDLAEAFLNWGGYAYGHDKKSEDGIKARDALWQRLTQIDVVVQNQDNREHDILDSDDYYQFQGGMSNAVAVYSGATPVIYHNDHSNPTQPKVRTLKEELNRVIRSRVLNPKWIKSMQAHGYKGAFEMAASVDYLFAYDATTNLIDDYQYQKVADTLVFDVENRAFLETQNIHALEEMAERLLEATQRGLWQNADSYADKLQDLLLDIDGRQEGQ